MGCGCAACPGTFILRGECRDALGGVHKIQQNPAGGLGGAVSALEDFKINAFQKHRTPVSLTFESQCCYTKIHAIFFTHSHLHHFQLNEVMPNRTL